MEKGYERLQVSTYDNFVEALKEVDEVEELDRKRKDPRKKFLDDAIKERKAHALDRYKFYALDDPKKGIKPLEPFNSWEDKKIPDDLNDDETDFTLKFSQGTSYKNALNYFSEEPDKVVKKIGRKSLEYLVITKDKDGKNVIRDYISDEGDKKIYNKFEKVAELENVIDRFKKGERSEYINQFYENAVITGLASDTEKSLRDAGFDVDAQKLGVGFAFTTLKAGRIDRSKIEGYAEDGLKKLHEEACRLYKNSMTNERDIYTVAREALAKGAKDKSTENFMKVFGSVYAALKEDNYNLEKGKE